MAPTSSLQYRRDHNQFSSSWGSPATVNSETGHGHLQRHAENHQEVQLPSALTSSGAGNRSHPTCLLKSPPTSLPAVRKQQLLFVQVSSHISSWEINSPDGVKALQPSLQYSEQYGCERGEPEDPSACCFLLQSPDQWCKEVNWSKRVAPLPNQWQEPLSCTVEPQLHSALCYFLRI